MGARKRDFISRLTRRQLIELEACVRCGACFEACVVQEATGDREVSPPAKIASYRRFVDASHGVRALLGKRPSGEEVERFLEALYACTTCGGCGEVCEVGIDTQRLWWAMRRELVEMGYSAPGTLPKLLENARRNRSIFASPLELRYRIWLPPEVKPAEEAELCYFEGCGVAWEAPPMAEAAVRLLHAANIEFTLLEASHAWCCGWPLAVAGMWELQQELVENNITKLEERGVTTLAVSCPCCLQQVREVWRSCAGGLPFEVVHITQVLAPAVEEGRLRFSRRRRERVTYHDPCQLTRGFRGPGVYEEPRTLIQHLPGVELVELDRSGRLTRCCGAGGGIRGARPEVALEIGKLFLRSAARTGAETLLMNCPACYAMYVARRLPGQHGEEWRAFRSPVRCNDLLQYAASFL
ncbi:MAG: (Fe-S)-binding protein [Euryarchaeota archaeon]|nr:(Fe-S)-binding protein [Euryarchaeota archaeon]